MVVRPKEDEGDQGRGVAWVEAGRERMRGVRSSSSAPVAEVVSTVTPSSSSSTRRLGVGGRSAEGREA